MCGKGSQTTTSQSAPNPQAFQAYSNLLNQAAGVASQPFVPYSGQFVAPINEQQQAGIGNINANAGFAQPYIQQAAGYATQAAQPITAPQINQYLSPYTQDVVNATEAQFNQQNQIQQNQLTGNAAAQGALGGDRVGVAQAALAGQQQLSEAPTIAGLYNQGYSTALQTALQEQQNLGQAAYSLGNLGVAGQNAALTGANAQIGAGTLEQSTQQALDQALYNQFLAQQGYPFQTTQWEAGIDTGVGSQMGGTSSTTGPPPNQTAQYLGLGLGALSLLNRGGGIHRDAGGRIQGFDLGGTPYAGGASYVPTIGLRAEGKGPPPPPNLPGQNQQSDPFKIASEIKGLGGGKGFGGLSGLFGGGDPSLDEVTQAGAEAGLSPEELGFGAGGEDLLAGGMGADMGMADLGALAFAKRGGRIAGFAAGGYADGGGDDSFDDSFNAFRSQPERLERQLGLGDLGFSPSLSTAPDDYSGSPSVPLPRPRPDSAPAIAGSDYANPLSVNGQPQNLTGDIIPPGGTGGAPAPVAGVGASPMSYAPQPDLSGYRPVPGTAGAPAIPQDQEKQSGFGGLFGNPLHMSDKMRQGLLAAGLGMMASRSPFLGVAVGEGGLAGLNAYSGAKKEEFNEEQARQKLEQHAKETADRLALETKKLESTQDYQRQHLEYLKQHSKELLEQGKYSQPMPGMGQNPGGENVPGAYITNTKTGEVIFKPNVVLTPKGASAPLPAEAWNVHGDEFLKYVPQDKRGLIKGLAAYDIDPKTLSVTGGRREEALNWTAQYDPSFDQKTYNERYNAVNRFATGPQGQNITSLNTTMYHLDTLEKAAEALNNGNVQALNQVGNFMSRQFGYPNVTNFEGVRDIAADEVVKSVLGTAGSDADRQEMRRSILAAGSPAQLHGIIERYQDMMAGRLHSLRYTFKDATGLGDEHFDRKLTPETRARLGKLEAGIGQPNAGGFTGRTATNPQTGQKLRETTSGQWVP